MKFIPYHKMTITTKLPKAEVISRFNSANIFSGKYADGKFNLRLKINYQNSFTPEITGTITEKANGTVLDVTLKSNSFAIGFGIVLTIFGAIFLISEIIDFTDMAHFSLMTVAFTILPYALCCFGFNLDAEKTIKGLMKITKGESDEA